MRICLIAEGSYPYITGGVSSWIQLLVSSMPEHEFIIYTINADKKNKGKFKYDLPANIVEIKEVFLDDYTSEEAAAGKRFHMTAENKMAIQSLLTEDPSHWTALFHLMTSRQLRSVKVTELMLSRDFFDMIQELAIDHRAHLPFTEWYWSARAMLMPLFWLLKHPPPEADLYHSVSTGYAGVVAAFAKFLYHKPFILTEHGMYTREREEEIIKADWVRGPFKDLWISYFYKLSHCAYWSSDQVITLFRKNKEIQIEMGCEAEKISIIPNGVNADDFASLAQKHEGEQSIINIGAIVRVVPIKDIKTMLQSFAIVKRHVPNTKFYILGPYDEDPLYYEECLQLVNLLQLQDVYFCGEVNVKDYIGQMDILALTSISEGQPLAMMEGMACSKPFVCTDVGSCSELLSGVNDGIGDAGIVVPVMDYEGLAQGMILLCEKPELRSMMGHNGRKRIKTQYTRDQFIAQYKQIYESKRFMTWQELAFNSGS